MKRKSDSKKRHSHTSLGYNVQENEIKGYYTVFFTGSERCTCTCVSLYVGTRLRNTKRIFLD